MKIRITRPELYIHAEDPGRLSNRQGYYLNANDGVDVSELLLVWAYSQHTENEVLDVQDWPSGEYLGRFKKIGDNFVRLKNAISKKSLAFCFHEEQSFAWSLEVDFSASPQAIANEAYQNSEFKPDYIWLMVNDESSSKMEIQYTQDINYNFNDVKLDDGGSIEFPECGTGRIRRIDKDGNCEDYRDPDDENYDEWAQLFDWTFIPNAYPVQ